jgi:hypothetical protein
MGYNERTPAVVKTGWRSNHPPVIRGNTAMAIWNSSTVRNCLHCSADISFRPPQAFFCGQSCTHKYHRKEAAELREPVTKECGYCTKPFVDDSPVKNGVYCSKVCKNKARTVCHGGTPRARMEPRTRPIVDGQRQCVKCDQWKPIEDFPKKKAAKFGVTQTCKRCVADSSLIRMTARRKANLDKFRKYERDYQRDRNKKKREAQGLPYVPQDEAYRKRVIENAYDRIIESNARQAFKWWFDKLTDEQVAAWYEAMGKPWLNPRLSDAEQFRIQYRNDHEFNSYQKMRRQLKKALYEDGIGDLIRSNLNRGVGVRSRKIEEMLGYTMNDLRVHLERQFTKGMSWEKFSSGEIHIDHITPKAAFDLLDYDQWKICWGLPNLQPLWARDNLRKSAKLLKLL